MRINHLKVNGIGIGSLVVTLLLGGSLTLRAEEGMWIPMLIEKYHIDILQEAGLRLDAEDIYSINKDCLKDAIVLFGGGCTGEMISSDGLLLTNHHCGSGVIQSHSSVEKNFLQHGFWAMDRQEELPNESLSVTFLRYMRDVTDEVREGIQQGSKEDARERKMAQNMGRIIRDATFGTYLDASIQPFYYGNEYYLFVYEKFLDVRLVGAPPVSIGNFGGDRDNWMWPRHTGDFSLFRVYANADNNPASYSPSNRPYLPRKHLEIKAGGIGEGDFTMILGYPKSTTQYLYSAAVRTMVETSLPLKIRLRNIRLEIMNGYMDQSDTVRIQYASKYRRVSNAWKKWQGVILGLSRKNEIEKKIEEEREFAAWVNSDGERQLKYETLLGNFSTLYEEMEQYVIISDMMNEAVQPVELFSQASTVLGMMRRGLSVESLEKQVEGFYKDFHLPVDRDVFAAMMEMCYLLMPSEFRPGFLAKIVRKHRGDFNEFAVNTYRKTAFSDKEKVLRLLNSYGKDPESAIKQVRKDPMITYLDRFNEVNYLKVRPELDRIAYELDKVYQIYMRALLEKSTEKRVHPDANFTMRLTHGKVEGYEPGDGIRYQYVTSLSGVIEKGKQEFEEYRVPEKLEQLFRDKDFGNYGVNGTMPVCFTASNHTSGGNSGSPVLDSDGRLIGINFDRNWEGTMSDTHYDPSICRNIAVDIRYVLFIIDKFAGAGYLLDEMNIIW